MRKTAKADVGVPAIDPDSLLCIGANMAEAATALLFCLSPLARNAPDHPFYTKLSAT
jgi:hypothetical protein